MFCSFAVNGDDTTRRGVCPLSSEFCMWVFRPACGRVWTERGRWASSGGRGGTPRPSVRVGVNIKVLCVFRSASGRVWKAKRCVSIIKVCCVSSDRQVTECGGQRGVCPYQGVLCVFRSAGGRVWKAKREVCVHIKVCCVFRSASGRVWRATKRCVSTSRCVVCLQIGKWQGVEGK